jgi:hypothetical protein
LIEIHVRIAFKLQTLPCQAGTNNQEVTIDVSDFAACWGETPLTSTALKSSWPSSRDMLFLSRMRRADEIPKKG